jgi:hypothetical protein
MAKKLYDLAVKTGEYQDATGQTKGRWTNVGAVVQQDDGGKFLLIDPHFNFAAVQRPPGKDRVAVSMFAPDSQQGGAQQAPAGYPQQGYGQAPQVAQRPAQGPAGYAPAGDDIPF